MMNLNCERIESKGKQFGINTLSNAELITLIINRGAGTNGALKKAEAVCSMVNDSLHTLAQMEPEQLEGVEGIGTCKAMAILAAFEFGKRYYTENNANKKLFCSSDIYNEMMPDLEGINHEEAWILLMNQHYKLIKKIRLSIGGLTETAVDIRIMMKQAVINNATVLVLVHNHPSENPHPSIDDDKLTERVQKACHIMRIYFLDHIIYAGKLYYSYKDNNRL